MSSGRQKEWVYNKRNGFFRKEQLSTTRVVVGHPQVNTVFVTGHSVVILVVAAQLGQFCQAVQIEIILCCNRKIVSVKVISFLFHIKITLGRSSLVSRPRI